MKKPIPTENGKAEMTPEQARKILQEQNQRKIADCKKRIDLLLAEYDCVLTGMMISSERGNQFVIQVALKQ